MRINEYIKFTEIIEELKQQIQNYPNQFNPGTTKNFSLQRQSNVSLKIFDMPGKEIKTLLDEEESNGNYKVDFNWGNIPSGVYFYQFGQVLLSNPGK